MATVDPKMRRNYYLLILSAISLQVTVSTIYMVLPLYFEQFGVNKSGTGVLISIGTFAGIVSGIIAGKFSDNYGRKPFLHPRHGDVQRSSSSSSHTSRAASTSSSYSDSSRGSATTSYPSS